MIFEKIVMHLASGETVELSPGQSNDSSVNPTDSHVDSADYVFKELYGNSVGIITYFNLDNIHEPIDVLSTGTIEGKDKSAQHIYKIRLKEGLRVNHFLQGVCIYSH